MITYAIRFKAAIWFGVADQLQNLAGVPVHGLNEDILIPEQAQRSEMQLLIPTIVGQGYLGEHFICDVL